MEKKLKFKIKRETLRIVNQIKNLFPRKKREIKFEVEPFSVSERKYQKNYVFQKKITFSILVPLFNTPKHFLRDMIDSVVDQTYPNWELCLVDASDSDHDYVEKIVKRYLEKDKRIVYKRLSSNKGISENTNEAFLISTGDYIGLLDHDDMLHPAALFEYMKAISDQGADFLYSDEDKFEKKGKIHFQPHFKPDYAIDNLRSNNYICHFTVFSRSIFNEDKLFRSICDGAQDHDLVLRLTEKAICIVHVPKILYHWRISANSTASDPTSKPYSAQGGIEAVQDALRRNSLQGTVSSSTYHPNVYRIRYELLEEPLISIIIPNKDSKEYLEKCIESILNLTTYANYEIVVIENNSVTEEVFEYYCEIKMKSNIKVVHYPLKGNFNYSALNNFAVSFCDGKYLMLLNNDIEVISPDWIQEMLMLGQREDVGAVGAKLYYPDDTIQHAGVIIGLGGVACHAHRGAERSSLGSNMRCSYVQNFSAVTAACLLIKKELFVNLNGFDERFAVAFNDVDLCLRLRDAGFLNCWTPYSELYHYESKSRGYDNTPEKQERFDREVFLLFDKWERVFEKGDPYYNQNLSLLHTNFSFKGDEHNPITYYLERYRKNKINTNQ